VRGADLLDSTPRQIYLQNLLKFATPRYCHVPVAVNASGEKLSKQTRALAVDYANPLAALMPALRFLGQQPPDTLTNAGIREFWDWALGNWRIDRVPRTRSVPAPAT
jgi:glutamyl-Q tRNA(Asp) synthetase